MRITVSTRNCFKPRPRQPDIQGSTLTLNESGFSEWTSQNAELAPDKYLLLVFALAAFSLQFLFL